MSEATTTRWEQYNEAGRLFFLQGDLARAEESFVAAVSEAESLGADNVRLASSLSNLGQLKYQQRDLASAERLFRRSLEIRERSLGHDHISVAQNLNNLAALHVARNEHTEAETLLVRALHINERERGGSHPDVAVTINNLAKLHFKRGDYASAEPLLLRLLALKQTPDKNNPEAAAVLASLATLRQATGHPAAAESLWKETLAVRERSLSATDAALAPTLEGLADACEAQRRWSEAIAHRERALAIRVQVMGADHPAVTAARGRIAELRQHLTENASASPPSRPEPRLSALQLSSLDVEKALQESAPSDASASPAAARLAPVNPWQESEPPDHIITGEFRPTGAGGAAVATPPRRGPTPGSSATIAPLRAPSPRNSTALPPTPGLGMFEVSASAPASVGAEPGIWWDPSSEQKQRAAHVAPFAHVPARRSDPARRFVDHAREDDTGHRASRSHATGSAPRTRRFGIVGGIAAGLVLVFGLAAWTLLGREDASPPAPAGHRVAAETEADPSAASVGESQNPVPDLEREVRVAATIPAPVKLPATPENAKSAPPHANTGAPLVAEKRASAPPAQTVASVQAHPVRATQAQPTTIAATEPALVTTIDPLLLPKAMDLEKITRAIDDSTRRKVEAATKKVEMKPPTFKEP